MSVRTSNVALQRLEAGRLKAGNGKWETELLGGERAVIPAKAGIQWRLDPGFRRGDEPFDSRFPFRDSHLATQHRPPIHVQHLPGNVPRVFAAQEHYRSGDVSRGRDAADWDRALDAAAVVAGKG